MHAKAAKEAIYNPNGTPHLKEKSLKLDLVSVPVSFFSPSESFQRAKKQKIAVAIFSFNRPGYLKQVLDSLERNVGLEAYDFYFFQDGAINHFSGRIATTEEVIKECLALWEQAALPNKHARLNPANFGSGITQYRAKEFLFEELGYERVMFFEDDLVLGPSYLHTLQVLLDQFEREPIVGVVMCHGEMPHQLLPWERNWYLRNLRCGTNAGFDHFWGWATWKDRWTRMKPYFLRYFRFIENVDYPDRPTSEILKFYRAEGCSIKYSTQDFGYYYSLAKTEMIQLNTFVHRGRYIGASGIHMLPAVYDRCGYSHVQLPNPRRDLRVTRFIGYRPQVFLAHFRFHFLLRDSPPTARQQADEAAYPGKKLPRLSRLYRRIRKKVDRLRKGCFNSGRFH